MEKPSARGPFAESQGASRFGDAIKSKNETSAGSARLRQGYGGQAREEKFRKRWARD